MKPVSFEVAKAIKEAGYPQFGTATLFVLEDFKMGNVIIPKGAEKENYDEDNFHLHPNMNWAAIPTYLDVWLWLCRKKGICVEIKDNLYHITAKVKNQRFYGDDPEEAIISMIDYLVEHNLIK